MRHDCVHHARHLGDEYRLRHQRRVDARFDPVVVQTRKPQVLDREAEFPRVANVLDVDARNAFDVHTVEVDGRVKGECRQDGELLGGVDALDVEGRVRFGVAQPLGVGKRRREDLPFLLHRGENVVGSSVDDARDGIDTVRGEAGAQGVDDGNAPGYGSFEAERDAVPACRLEELLTVRRQQCLVGRDDVATGTQRRGNNVPCRGHAADQFHHHVDIVGIERGEIRIEGCRAQVDVGFGRSARNPG